MKRNLVKIVLFITCLASFEASSSMVVVKNEAYTKVVVAFWLVPLTAGATCSPANPVVQIERSAATPTTVNIGDCCVEKFVASKGVGSDVTTAYIKPYNSNFTAANCRDQTITVKNVRGEGGAILMELTATVEGGMPKPAVGSTLSR